MKISEKISPLLPYIKEIKFSEKHVLVGGVFYPKWIVNDKKDGVIKIVKSGEDETGKTIYHFYGLTTQVDVDTILDYFSSVVNENLDRERKEDLFKKKVNELKTIFKGNTLTDLEKLSMDIKEIKIEKNIDDE
tara:strand:- start:1139 stop:1537 length:399 start_codon:yes stop_codon:yes gene_type:complete